MNEMIEVVIKLPKYYYEALIKDKVGCEVLVTYKAIANGTLLPKGHGRLIDADSMKRIDAIQMGDFNSIESIRAWIDIMPTVIEADKEVKDENY